MWPAVYFSSKTVSLAFACLFFLLFKSGLNRHIHTGLIFTFLLIFLQAAFIDGLHAVPQTMPYLIGLFLFQLKDIYKQQLLISVTKITSAIVLTGLIFYFLWLIVGFQPIGYLKEPFYYGDHYNYFFFILPVLDIFPRFSGPFIEPGHLGMISVFLIYANNFQFLSRKYLWILLAGILVSLSLAAYILLFAAICIKMKPKIQTILTLIILTIGLSYVVMVLWGNGDNPVNNLIYARLEYDETKGIAGNNRTTESTDMYYERMLKSGDIYLGKGGTYMQQMFMNGTIMGAGYKMYFMQLGIIGALLVLMYYFIIANACENKYYAYGFLLLYCTAFIQRAYPYWMAWLVPYICGMNPLNFNNPIKKAHA